MSVTKYRFNINKQQENGDEMEILWKLIHSGAAVMILGAVTAIAFAAPTKNKDNEKRNERIQIALYLGSIVVALYFIWWK
ncbi:hypothetical protein [Marinicellulosiphila megalodicopiae]|uniref:hypothetical protein n=1 Tax=Marinicellulosiphila megalodicopiae TaxID=2724896 RepID=UPI003BAF318A